jgi:hypothetical protein
VLALHCGEGATRAAFDELLGRLYPADRCDRAALPGGAWWLAEAANFSEGRLKRMLLGGRLPAREAVEAMLGATALREVVLLGHQDCAWYRQRFPRHTPGDLVREQGADILRARAEIARWAPRALPVSGWLLLATPRPEARRLV